MPGGFHLIGAGFDFQRLRHDVTPSEGPCPYSQRDRADNAQDDRQAKAADKQANDERAQRREKRMTWRLTPLCAQQRRSRKNALK